MDTRKKIKEAQERIVCGLADCESAVAELYETYAELLPEMREFWADLAEAEHQHAEQILAIRSDLEEGTILFNLDHFRPDRVNALRNFILDSLRKARESALTPREAVAVALRVESSIIDSRFFDIVHSEGAVFKAVAAKLTQETGEHVKRVQQAQLMF